MKDGIMSEWILEKMVCRAESGLIWLTIEKNGLQGGEWIDLAYDRKKMVCRAESGLI